MLVFAFLLFVALPILEIYVIIQVGQAIGALPTLALLIADSLLGAWLMRSQGRIVWRRFTAALEQGRPPAKEVLDGALVIVGGALQLAPGFLTDITGLLMVLPPTRGIIRRLIARRATMGLGIWAVGRANARRGGGAGSATRAARDYDVEGTAHEETERHRLP